MATLIIKATEKCNSNCYYCDVVRNKQKAVSMTENVLETLFMKSNEYLQKYPSETIEFIWHGGEPLLLGADFYKKACLLQNTCCANTKSRIKHSIQTNLTCFTENFIGPFLELGITAIGTSFDPEPNMRGPGKTIDSGIYNSMFMNALSILEKYDLKWGLIYVVTKKSLQNPMKIFYYLTNLVSGGGINFNQVLIYDNERKDVAISPSEFMDFLGTIFPVWFNNMGKYPYIGPFSPLVDTIINKKTSLGCVESGNCTNVHMNISPEGNASQCGRSSDWGLLDYGNIADRPFDEILFDKQRDVMKERLEVLQKNDCKGCRFWTICHGGCPLDSWSGNKDFMHKSEWCEARRGFIEKYFEPVTGVRFEPEI